MSKSNLDTITLDGSPAYGSKLDKAISGFAKPVMGFLAAAPPILIHHPVSLFISAPILAGTALGENLFNKTLKGSFKIAFGANHQKLYIVKKPDKNTIPTKPEHLAAAYLLKQAYAKNLLLRASGFSIGAVIGMNTIPANIKENLAANPIYQAVNNNNQELLFSVVITAALTGVSYVLTDIFKNAETVYRFHKVVKGDWVITDEPPKELVREPLASIAKRKFAIFLPPAPAPSTTREYPENRPLKPSI